MVKEMHKKYLMPECPVCGSHNCYVRQADGSIYCKSCGTASEPPELVVTRPYTLAEIKKVKWIMEHTQKPTEAEIKAQDEAYRKFLEEQTRSEELHEITNEEAEKKLKEAGAKLVSQGIITQEKQDELQRDPHWKIMVELLKNTLDNSKF